VALVSNLSAQADLVAFARKVRSGPLPFIRLELDWKTAGKVVGRSFGHITRPLQ
jgi:hypothetical protein